MSTFRLKGSAATIALAVAAIGTAYGAEEAAGETTLTPMSGGAPATQSTLDPSYGSIDAFYGNLDAFYGSLSAFYGNLDAFYGNLDAFYGNLDAFYGSLDAFYGSLNAFYGNLDAFYGSLNAFYGSLNAFYGKLDAFYGSLNAFSGDPAELKADLVNLFTQAEASFGAAVTQQTGGLFDAGIVAPLLAKYGVNAADMSGAENLTRAQYSALLLELHDTVMSHSGLDQYDHWMSAVNWSPQLALNANQGRNITVGILDTQLYNESLIGGEVEESYGYSVKGQEHGAAVASLIAAAHDGKGAMGIAPRVEVIFSNPFDATHTASWLAVRNGLKQLGNEGASVANISLGVSGSTLHSDWAPEAFARADVQSATEKVVFVKAAGNSGLAQQTDLDWTSVVDTSNAFGFANVHERLLIVGSLDLNGNISDFSNRPGEACLLVNGQCGAGHALKDRFLVAPGELLLVGNNSGGVSRATGTSFAAPLVTGAVALVQNNWSWLKNHPIETADIILSSAKDLGAPGVDAVYGHGLLDIGAAMAPLDPAALTINVGGGDFLLSNSGLTVEGQALFSNQATITAFETIGGTYRDFAITLESLGLATADPSANVDAASQDYLQSMTTTVSTNNNGEADEDEEQFDDFAFTNQKTLNTLGFGDKESRWTAQFVSTLRDQEEVVTADAVPFQMSAIMKNNANGLLLRFGQGQSALALNSSSTFGMTSDHDIKTGGVNPFLGLASGGFYAGAAMPVAKNLSMSFAFTQDTDKQAFIDTDSGELRELYTGVEDYEAAAVSMEFNYTVSEAVDVSVGYTQLHEATGFLGAQGAGLLNLEGGAVTDAATLGANADLGRGIALSASATLGKTRAGAFDNSILSVGDDGVTSTAFQIAALKKGVFGKKDQMRFSIAQPMHLEAGALEATTMQVVDRATGELDLVASELELHTNDRRFVSELIYATSIFEGRGSLSAFSQVDMNNRELGFAQTAVAGGGRLDIRF